MVHLPVAGFLMNARDWPGPSQRLEFQLAVKRPARSRNTCCALCRVRAQILESSDEACELHRPWAEEFRRRAKAMAWSISSHGSARVLRASSICCARDALEVASAPLTGRARRFYAGGNGMAAAAAGAGENPVHRHQLRQPQCRLRRYRGAKISEHVFPRSPARWSASTVIGAADGIRATRL